MFDSSITFNLPWVFALLPLPIIVYFLFPARKENNITALPVPFFGDLSQVQSTSKKKRSWIMIAFSLLIWLSLLIAAARPQSVGETVNLPISGRDLMLAVDISGSMEAADMEVRGRLTNRLNAVKMVAGDFIDKRAGDRIGLILFGRNAYLQTPLTFDRKTVKTLLYESAIGLAGTETAMGDAIGLAVKRLRNKEQNSTVLIILTDGANTAGHVSPLKAADLAANENIKIHTIGIGTDRITRRGLLGALRTRHSDLDEKTLTAIAKKTGGRYFRARNTNDLEKIYQILDELEPINEDNQSYRPITELYQWPLALAFLLSLLLSVVKILQDLVKRYQHA